MITTGLLDLDELWSLPRFVDTLTLGTATIGDHQRAGGAAAAARTGCWGGAGDPQEGRSVPRRGRSISGHDVAADRAGEGHTTRSACCAACWVCRARACSAWRCRPPSLGPSPRGPARAGRPDPPAQLATYGGSRASTPNSAWTAASISMLARGRIEVDAWNQYLLCKTTDACTYRFSPSRSR